MKIKYKKQLKTPIELEKGDNIKVGGLVCEVTKAETVFHRTPDARVRLELTVVGATHKNELILLLEHGLPITTLK